MPAPSRTRAALRCALASTLLLFVFASGPRADDDPVNALGFLKGQDDHDLSYELNGALDHLSEALDILGPVDDGNAGDAIPVDRRNLMIFDLEAALDHADEGKFLFLDPFDDPLLGIECIENRKIGGLLFRCLEKNLCEGSALIAEILERLEDADFFTARDARRGKVEDLIHRAGSLINEADANLCGFKNRRRLVRRRPLNVGLQTARIDGSRMGFVIRMTFDDRPRIGWKRTDFLRVRLRARITRALADARAKPPKNRYLAFQAKGSKKKFEDEAGFGFATTLANLTGDFRICVDAGLFSTKKKNVQAAGDGEFGCIELSTVGSAPTERFASFCARVTDQQGLHAFIGLPNNQTQGDERLPGVTIGKLIIEKRGNDITYSIRDTNPASVPQQVAVVASPPEPLTFSLGAAGMGPKDEYGFDNVNLEILFPGD